MSQTSVGIRIEGGLLTRDLLAVITNGRDLKGLTSKDFGLPMSVRDAAAREWSYLLPTWKKFQAELSELSADDLATSLTRRWLNVLFGSLGYGRLQTTPAGGLHADDRSFPISHQWAHVPMHLLGRVDLDHRSRGVAGAAEQSPQSMVQEFLNLSGDHLWGLLANATTLRLLRDSTSLAGASYVEFDLSAIFGSELFSDFLTLFTLCHASRLEVLDEQVGPESCWLEIWRRQGIADGTRALDQLRNGVEQALQILGSGFLNHPANVELRQKVTSEQLSLADFNHALLRVVYRLLFTCVAEDRDALLSPDASAAAKERYAKFFSTRQLRDVSRRRSGGPHADRWQALQLVWRGLGSPDGFPELGLPGLGGLFEPGELDFLADASLRNADLLAAVRQLSLVSEAKSKRTRVVNYRDLDAEELGSIYEALLELVPRWDAAGGEFSFVSAAGNDRKTTGSYYTPRSLVEALLDSALDPVLDEAVARGRKSGDVAAELLSIKVCDPACGSGAFLVAAARRIAKRVAAARAGDPEPPPAQIREALRDVVAHCIHGVDINPLAAELAKISLWLMSLDPGRPLTFLDAQIKVGNSLLGVTPRLLAGGVPKEAFKELEGDDKKVAKDVRARNAKELKGADQLPIDYVGASNSVFVHAHEQLRNTELSLADVAVHRRRLQEIEASQAYRNAKLAADAWCAAFAWPLHPDAAPAPTSSVVQALQAGDGFAAFNEADANAMRAELARLSAEYRFFHWHLEFPHIFPTEPRSDDDVINETTGWYGGFDVVLGNPPWERVKLQEKEFFASRDQQIADAPNASVRQRLIRELPKTRPELLDEFNTAKRRAEAESLLLHKSGVFPLAGRRDINTYAVFAELDRNLIAPLGRMGIIVPTGIATDATTQFYFKDLVTTRSLVSLFDFENSSPIFVGVHKSYKFCLLAVAGRTVSIPKAEFAFFLKDPVELNREDATFELTPEEIKLINPNTGTVPIFRSRRDADITLGIYRRMPVLINENDPEGGNPWGIRFMRMFDMSNDSHLFYTREDLESDGWILNGNVFEREIGASEREREREIG